MKDKEKASKRYNVNFILIYFIIIVLLLLIGLIIKLWFDGSLNPKNPIDASLLGSVGTFIAGVLTPFTVLGSIFFFFINYTQSLNDKRSEEKEKQKLDLEKRNERLEIAKQNKKRDNERFIFSLQNIVVLHIEKYVKTLSSYCIPTKEGYIYGDESIKIILIELHKKR